MSSPRFSDGIFKCFNQFLWGFYIRDLNFVLCYNCFLIRSLTNSVFLNSVDLKKNMQHKSCKVRDFYSRSALNIKRAVT